MSRTNWSVQCSVHVHTFWRNWIPPKKSTGLKRILIDIWLTHDREWQLLHDYSPDSRIQIKGHELTHYTCFLHCTRYFRVWDWWRNTFLTRMSDGPSQQTFPFQEIDQFGVKCIGGDKLTESLYVVSGSIQTEFHSIGDPVSVRIR